MFAVCTVAFVSADPAAAQTGDYEVTAHLSPFFIHPVTGKDVTGGAPFEEVNGWERGADGRFYAIRRSIGPGEFEIFQLLRVSPTTGAATVLVVGEAYGSDLYDFSRGLNGRLYFTVIDGFGLEYVAPGYDADDCNGPGCVMVVDTAAPGQPLRAHFAFEYEEEEGWYPQEETLVEDVDGAIYIEAGWVHDSPTCDSTQIVKIPLTTVGYGDAIVVHCGPGFDWSSIPRSDTRWRWSDGYVGPGRGGLVEGSGYLYGITSAGGTLGGGYVYRKRVPSLASPDLQVTTLSAPPAVLAPGSGFSVTDTTHNGGPEPSAESSTSYYLSVSGEVPDIKLTNSRAISELSPGQEATGSRNVKVPSTAATGTYWLIACADAEHDVPEGDEGNNCTSAASQVTIGRPDLRGASVSATATLTTPGSRVDVNDAVNNPSAVTVGKATTRYYLSLDQAKSAGDVLLTGKRTTPELPSGATNLGHATVTLPSSVAPAAYYVLACADDLAKLKESDETNNCAASESTILVGWPDLVATHVSDPPSTLSPGQKFTVTDTISNQGTVTAGQSTTRYLLSLNATRDGADILLAGTRALGGLLVGATSTGSKRVTVPSTTAPGAYYVLACADDLQKVAESNDANNCRSSAATVGIHP